MKTKRKQKKAEKQKNSLYNNNNNVRICKNEMKVYESNKNKTKKYKKLLGDDAHSAAGDCYTYIFTQSI